jgi:hypothetical protein
VSNSVEIGHGRVALSANSAQFESDMKRARKAVQDNSTAMQKAMQQTGVKFNAAAAALNKYAGVAAVGAAVGFTAFIKKQVDAADAIGKMAQATGTSTEFLSSMGFVAEQSGTSLESVAKATQKLAKNMDDVRKGTGEAQDAFKDLGITVTDGNGVMRSSEDVLLDIAAKFKGLENGAEKTNLAIRLFGRSGAELVPMLNQGKDGIQALQRRAEELGLVIGTETAMQAAFLNDQLHQLKMSAVGFGRSIAIDILPGLNEAIKTIRFAHEESGLLAAVWVALGAAGHALFSKSLTREIKDTEEVVANLEASVEKLSKKRGFRASKDLEFEMKRLEEWRAKLAGLHAQRDQEEKAQADRMKAAYDRAQKEAEQRRAATEAMRAQAEERMRLEKLTADEVAAEKARVKAAEDAVEAIEKQIAALELQRETFGMTTREATLYQIGLMQGVTPAQIELADAILTTIEAQEKQKDITDKAQTVFDSTRTKQERYAETVKELRELVDKGAISFDTYSRAVLKAGEALEEMGDKGKEKFDELKQAIEGWGRDSADAIVKFVMTGKMSFKDLVDSMIADLLRMIVYQKVTSPLFAMLNAGLAALGAGAGAFAGQGSGTVGSMPTPGTYLGGRASGGPVYPGQTYLVGEEGPELLRMGSRTGNVIPNDALGGGGSFEQTVHIHNATGSGVSTSTSQDGRTLEIYIEEAAVRGVSKALQRGDRGLMSSMQRARV